MNANIARAILISIEDTYFSAVNSFGDGILKRCSMYHLQIEYSVRYEGVNRDRFMRLPGNGYLRPELKSKSVNNFNRIVIKFLESKGDIFSNGIQSLHDALSKIYFQSHPKDRVISCLSDMIKEGY